MSTKAWLVLICGGLILSISLGVRHGFGLYLENMRLDFGLQLGVLSLGLAIQNLFWGAAQPVAGILADRYGTAKVIAGGGVLYTFGLFAMTQDWGELAFYMNAGVILGIGIAATSFPIILGAVAKAVPEERRSSALGITSALGSLGQVIFAPISQGLIDNFGWINALLVMALIATLMVLLALEFRGNKEALGTATPEPEQTMKEAFKEAFGHNSYILLNFGFFVCGFHVAFILTHLPMFLATCNIPPVYGGIALSVVGFFNIIGTYLAGQLGGKYSKKYLLSGIYGLRALVILLYIAFPITPTTTLIFAGAMGALWLSTVPLTSGLVGVFFGTRYMTTLFAIVMFSHQVGAFLGAWLGGILFDMTGSYDGAWWASIALGIFAAIVHLPIKERSARTPQPA